MAKIGKKQFKKTGAFLKKLPRALGENAFLTSLIFFAIAMILGGIAFYKYSILAEKEEPKLSEMLLYFDEKNLQDVLKFWQDRQIKFQEADSKQYLNPFKVGQ